MAGIIMGNEEANIAGDARIIFAVILIRVSYLPANFMRYFNVVSGFIEDRHS